MRVRSEKTADLAGRAAPYNPRQISEHDLEALCRSMDSFGVVEPIVVNDTTGNIVGGHQRVKAAQKLGLDKLPTVRVQLDPTQEKILNVALNRISGEFDDDLLATVVRQIKEDGEDPTLTGLLDGEIEDLIRIETNTGGDGDGSGGDEQPELCADCADRLLRWREARKGRRKGSRG